jgi:hypothetical protein
MAAMAGGHSAKASKVAIVGMAILSVALLGAGLITSAMLPGAH